MVNLFEENLFVLIFLSNFNLKKLSLISISSLCRFKGTSINGPIHLSNAKLYMRVA